MLVRFFFDADNTQIQCTCSDKIEWPYNILPSRGDVISPDIMSKLIPWGSGALSYIRLENIFWTESLRKKFCTDYKRYKQTEDCTEKTAVFKAASFIFEDMFYVAGIRWDLEDNELVPRICLQKEEPAYNNIL